MKGKNLLATCWLQSGQLEPFSSHGELLSESQSYNPEIAKPSASHLEFHSPSRSPTGSLVSASVLPVKTALPGDAKEETAKCNSGLTMLRAPVLPSLCR